jgi:ATP synthase I chain
LDQVLTEELLLGAYRRLQSAMLVLFLVAVFPISAIYGKAAGTGFVIGSAVSALSFLWLRQSVHALAGHIAKTENNSGTSAIVLRFLARYALIGVAGYVITLGSHRRLYGFLVGLQLWVFGLLFEAIYEAIHGSSNFSH